MTGCMTVVLSLKQEVVFVRGTAAMQPRRYDSGDVSLCAICWLERDDGTVWGKGCTNIQIQKQLLHHMLVLQSRTSAERKCFSTGHMGARRAVNRMTVTERRVRHQRRVTTMQPDGR